MPTRTKKPEPEMTTKYNLTESPMIALNSFVRRQTPDSPFSYTTLTDAALIARIEAAMPNAKPGYRPDVILVPVAADGFLAGGPVKYEPGMTLIARYESRRPGETPRLTVGVEGCPKPPACAVEIVLYASKCLAEDGHNELPAEDGNWEVISINARATEGEEPIHPETLIANHLHESGGTATNMSDEEFVAALRKSRDYWAGRVLRF